MFDFVNGLNRFKTTIHDTVLFIDEKIFTNHGNVNLHNMHFWTVENPWLR